jgi:hypothetical protein
VLLFFFKYFAIHLPYDHDHDFPPTLSWYIKEDSQNNIENNFYNRERKSSFSYGWQVSVLTIIYLFKVDHWLRIQSLDSLDKTFTRFDYVSYPLGASGFTPSILVGSVLIIFFSFLCCDFCFTFLHSVSSVQCCLCLWIDHSWLPHQSYNTKDKTYCTTFSIVGKVLYHFHTDDKWVYWQLYIYSKLTIGFLRLNVGTSNTRIHKDRLLLRLNVGTSIKSGSVLLTQFSPFSE